MTSLLSDLAYPLPPLFTPGEKIATSALLLRADDAWLKRDELAAHLRAVMPETRRLAERNFDVLDDLIARE